MKLPSFTGIVLILLVLVIFVFDGFNFLVNRYSGVNLFPPWSYVIREIMLVSAYTLFFVRYQQKYPVLRPAVIKSTWTMLIWTSTIAVMALITGFLPIEINFVKTEGALLPESFFTLLKVYALGILLAFFMAQLWANITAYVVFKPTRYTRTIFSVLLLLVFIVSLMDTNVVNQFQLTFIQVILTVLMFALVAFNAFRLSWVLYITRRDKVISLFLIFILVSMLAVAMSTNLLNEKDSLNFLTPAYYTFISTSLIYLLIFASISFFSILFHLPTSEAFERKSSEIASLHNLSKLISEVFDLDELTLSVVSYSKQTTNSDIGWVELHSNIDKPPLKTKILSPDGISTAEIQTMMANPKADIRKEIVEKQETLIITNAKDSHFFNKELVKTKKINTVASIPLIARGHLIGSLFVAKTGDLTYDKEDLDILSTFADQAAIALDNSRLLDESLEKERLQQELFIAQKMQMKLLPQSNPVTQNLEIDSISYPAYEVGGDYFDFVELRDHKLGVIVADVSGKGTSAAFYMAEVKGIFQALARNAFNPSALISSINEILLESLDRNSFVSVIYAVFDLETGDIQTARAGHCPILIVSDNGQSRYVQSKGIGVGLTHTAKFTESLEEVDVKLKKGDVCVLFSDGVVEAMDADMDEYGYDRLSRVIIENRHLPANEILAKVISDINTHIFEGRANDDMTLIVTKWNPKSI